MKASPLDCHRCRKRLGATRTHYLPEAAPVVLCVFCMENVRHIAPSIRSAQRTGTTVSITLSCGAVERRRIGLSPPVVSKSQTR